MTWSCHKVFSDVFNPVADPGRDQRRGHYIREATHDVFSPGIWWIVFKMNLSGSEVQILQMYS
jgi:hypothetical protein